MYPCERGCTYTVVHILLDIWLYGCTYGCTYGYNITTLFIMYLVSDGFQDQSSLLTEILHVQKKTFQMLQGLKEESSKVCNMNILLYNTIIQC